MWGRDFLSCVSEVQNNTFFIQNNYALNTVSLKKGMHSEQWPWPVEITYRQETIHASLFSEGDQRILLDSVMDRVEDPRTPTTPRVSHVPMQYLILLFQ